MATDTTASSYWLNWRVLLCALILLAPLVLAAILIWRYEGKRREGREQPGTLFQDEAWTTCHKRVHPRWLLVFRVFSFAAMLSLLISNVVRDGAGIFYFYTQWTFTLVTLYFGYASSLSIYGCCIYNKEAGGSTESYTSIHDAEQGTYRPPITRDESGTIPKSPIPHSEAPVREAAGFWVYVFQVQFQTCAGAVVLTDIVFWAIIYPFTNGYKLSLLDVCMHSLNAVFLLGDTCLNSLRFPVFRISYFILWSCIYVAYQWIIHAFKNLWLHTSSTVFIFFIEANKSFKRLLLIHVLCRWPYQFLSLFSPYAPLWYLGVTVMHIPCFAVFALVIKMKSSLLRRHNSS